MQKNSIKDRYSPLLNPLIIALDVDTDAQALRLTAELKDLAGGFKLGPRLIHRYGQSLTLKISEQAPVFVDCKFFDIPSTMEAAIQASFDSGASLVTVHALSGEEALLRMSELEKKLNAIRPFRILCVTILTSWSQQSFPANFLNQPVKDHVQTLAQLVKKCGLQGIVCSPEELDILADQDLYLVTPGIRLDKNDKSDQKRTKTPYQAMKAGASALVVGRPIVQATDPRAAAMEISLAMVSDS